MNNPVKLIVYAILGLVALGIVIVLIPVLIAVGIVLMILQSFFGVKVAKVNTVRMQGKVKRTGAYPAGKQAAYKKAVVTLTADSKTIEFFEGMV